MIVRGGNKLCRYIMRSDGHWDVQRCESEPVKEKTKMDSFIGHLELALARASHSEKDVD